MAGVSLGVQADVQDLAETYDVDKVRQFLAVLQGQGYFLSNSEETASLTIKDPSPFYGLLHAGSTPRIATDLVRFAQGGFTDWGVIADLTQEGTPDSASYLIFQLSERGPYLHTNSKQFNNHLTHPLWMHFVRALYSIWHPVYLFPAYDVGEPQNSREQVLAHQLRWLHMEYNYFGPELVDAMGRERLLATPGVEVIPLIDGGINIGQGDTQQAADYLGLAKSPPY